MNTGLLYCCIVFQKCAALRAGQDLGKSSYIVGFGVSCRSLLARLPNFPVDTSGGGITTATRQRLDL